ncbi:hypothetical protein M885DRAFT_592908 [Pelagophyceae sp. CCMP2097]|nr:hypothetical protein M885DRAFT_592908 [Pelagophyceae sp. CCMP2097]
MDVFGATSGGQGSILLALPAELLLQCCARVPFLSRGALAGTCRRLRDDVASPAYSRSREDGGWAETAVIVLHHDFGALHAPVARVGIGGTWFERPLRPGALQHAPRRRADSGSGASPGGRAGELRVLHRAAGADAHRLLLGAYDVVCDEWRVLRDATPSAPAWRVPRGTVPAAHAAWAGPRGQPGRQPDASDFWCHCELDGRIYVFTTLSHERSLFSIHLPAMSAYVFDASAGTWRALAWPPAAFDEPACAALGGRVYVVEGHAASGRPPRDAVLVYDVAADAWRTGPSLPAPTAGAHVAVVGGVVHVRDARPAAGASKTARAYALDAAAGTWATVPLRGGGGGPSVLRDGKAVPFVHGASRDTQPLPDLFAQMHFHLRLESVNLG